MTQAVQIAVVDDDKGMRDALEGLILSLGYTPRCFASPAEFLGTDDRSAMACAILDITMPGMSGLELQDILAAEPRPLPVIILSSFVDGPRRRKAIANGATCVLVKPVDDAALCRCIETAIVAGH